jgi:hypothetical protein
MPEEYAAPASDLALAVIEPVSTTLTTGWDAQPAGGLDYTATLNVILLARSEDPQLRDELAEQLLHALHNAINGLSLASFTLPGRTMVTSWRWMPQQPPERRICATVSFAYLVTWEGWDTSN